MNRKPLIILTGPTSVGKTELSISLAKAVNGEIISADSMQVYRKMDIGTAKITPEEMAGVKHHLIDVLDPSEDFNVFLFKELAKKAMDDIYNRGHIPILTGGTGFYIQSVLYDIDFSTDDGDNSYRHELEALAEEKGAEYLHNILKEVDSESAQEIHYNNVKRVIRALEYYHQTGEKISIHNKEQRQKESPYNFAYFVLNDERAMIYDRINRRVDIMIKNGLVEEVSNLVNEGYTKELVSMQGLGYKEIIDYLNGEISLDEAIYRIKRDTRHFAKRQLTWFGREREVIFVNKNEFNYDTGAALDYMLECLKNKQIIKDINNER